MDSAFLLIKKNNPRLKDKALIAKFKKNYCSAQGGNRTATNLS